MTGVELLSMDLKLLPSIAHASSEGLPPPHPRSFEAVGNEANFNRPKHGLWCSPVTARAVDGVPTATAWTDWLANPGDVTGQPSGLHGTYTRFTAVEPLPETRIYQIDTADDLDLLVRQFPLPSDHWMHRTSPDWEATAAAHWDAVYASEAGFAANAERFVMREPSLYGWDCTSVLWLRPAYRLTTP